MHYEGTIIRPPSEAFSILLQVTLGCSHNKCTFCGTYKDKRFTIKDNETILHDIKFASKYMRNQDRVFLMDGDPLIIPQKRLIWILDKINEYLPWVRRIGIYANAKSIKMKTLEELKELKKRKLGIVYMGVESGDDVVLKRVRKGVSSKTMLEMGKKVMEAGIKLSVTVLLGIGGRERSLIHARKTGELLTAMDPDYVGALTLMLIPGTPLHDDYIHGRFELPSQEELLLELREMVYHTNLSKGMFFSNHASNYLPLKIRYPHGKEEALRMIDKALQGEIPLRP
ncbi:MAG: radical SAM protein, partial [Deltaproteobacteria bacterium]